MRPTPFWTDVLQCWSDLARGFVGFMLPALVVTSAIIAIVYLIVR